jgi:hypothetical protein
MAARSLPTGDDQRCRYGKVPANVIGRAAAGGTVEGGMSINCGGVQLVIQLKGTSKNSIGM